MTKSLEINGYDVIDALGSVFTFNPEYKIMERNHSYTPVKNVHRCEYKYYYSKEEGIHYIDVMFIKSDNGTWLIDEIGLDA